MMFDILCALWMVGWLAGVVVCTFRLADYGDLEVILWTKIVLVLVVLWPIALIDY